MRRRAFAQLGLISGQVVSCKPEGPLFWEKLPDPGWHQRKNNHRIQHQTLPLQPAPAEPPGATSSPTRAQSGMGVREAPREPRVSPSFPTHTFLCGKAKDAVLSQPHRLLPHRRVPERDRRSPTAARSWPASFKQEGNKERGTGRRNIVSPFFFSFFSLVSPPTPKDRKTNREQHNC